MDEATPSILRRYGTATLAVLLALLLDLLLWPWAKPTAFPLFTAAVLFASWYGGLGPGLLATVLATVAGRYFFTEPYYTFTVDAGVLIRLIMFAVMVAATTYATNARRRSERALGESEGRYRTLTEALPQLVWTCRPDGSCDYLSRQWVEYTGVPEDEQLGLKWLDRVIHPEDRERAFSCWTAAVEGRGAYDLEYRILGADGGYRWFQTRGLPLRDAGGGIAKWFGTCTDIDEKKRAETGLREAKEAAEEANRAKDAFLAALSHELRTPLTPVLLTVSALHSDPRIPEELREELWMVRRNVEMEARLIDDLLDLTRIAQGKLELRSEVVNLHDIARHAATICRPEIEAKGLTLTLDLRARRHRVRGDGGRLQQVLWNLLKNAAKFTPEGGAIALVTEDVDSDGLRFRVSDTGIGIPPAALPRLFHAFEQGDRAITKQFGGLGLGLAISKALVDAHGGTIRVDSEGHGKGATFTVELPEANYPTEAGGGPGDIGGDGERSRSLRILLVDDHGDTLRVLSRMVRGLGHAVTTAESVATALDASAAGPFDLLVSDVGLPDGSGVDLMRRLRPMPGIALTGYGMDSDIEECREAGFVAHLTKPVDFARLEEAIRRVAAKSGDRPASRGVGESSV